MLAVTAVTITWEMMVLILLGGLHYLACGRRRHRHRHRGNLHDRMSKGAKEEDGEAESLSRSGRMIVAGISR